MKLSNRTCLSKPHNTDCDIACSQVCLESTRSAMTRRLFIFRSPYTLEDKNQLVLQITILDLS